MSFRLRINNEMDCCVLSVAVHQYQRSYVDGCQQLLGSFLRAGKGYSDPEVLRIIKNRDEADRSCDRLIKRLEKLHTKIMRQQAEGS